MCIPIEIPSSPQTGSQNKFISSGNLFLNLKLDTQFWNAPPERTTFFFLKFQ